MTTDIKGLEKRTARYWFEDGLSELGLGGLCAWLALYFLAQSLAPDKSTFKFVVDVGFLPWFLLGGWIMPKIVRSLKQGLTYRRTGFVAYRRPEKKTRVRRSLIAGFTAGLVSFGFVFLFTHRPSFVDPVPIISGLAFTVVVLAIFFRTGAWRLIPVAAAVAACGTFLSLRGWSDSLNLVAFYAFTAAALFVSGGLTLALYLRRNPIQPGAGE
jgi:hypothetical protein